MNIYEAQNRTHKALQLVATIDAARTLEIDGQDWHLFSDLIATESDDFWAKTAAAANVNPPSPETIAMIVGMFRGRATYRTHTDPFHGLS